MKEWWRGREEHIYVNYRDFCENHRFHVIYQSKTITEHKHVTYDGQLRPIIVKSNLVPNAQVRQQIIHRHYEELKKVQLPGLSGPWESGFIDALNDTILLDCAPL